MKKLNYVFSDKENSFLGGSLFSVLAIGFIIRLFACRFTYVVNPDGVLYIHQAKAIFFGQWEKIMGCDLSYLSCLPFCIAGAYTIFKDWVIAAQTVSFIFGFVSLIPLYLLFRQFFDKNISGFGTLIYALMPVLVLRSADVVRGPIYWFFLVMGLYFFVSSISRSSKIFLILSSISYILAAWARIEAILFIIVSCLFILLTKQEKKIEKLIIFISPVIIIALMSYLNLSFFSIPISEFNRADEIKSKFMSPILSYLNMRDNLKILAEANPNSALNLFLPEARTSILIVALGSLINRILEAIFYPFIVIFLCGFYGIRKKIKEDKRILYLMLISASGLILIYVHIIQYWMVYYRFVVIAIFPCFILAGMGIENIISYLKSKFTLKTKAALAIIFIFILISGLPRNLANSDTEKIPFRKIGETISAKEGNDKVVPIAASSKISYRFGFFYANLDNPDVACPIPAKDDIYKTFDDYDIFIEKLRKKGVKYFIWDEKNWYGQKFDAQSLPYTRDFKELGRWTTPDTGQIILFEVI